MTGDDGSSAWSLADSTYDLGMGSYAYQSGSSLETRVEDLAIDSGCPSSSGDGAELANKVGGAHQSTQKVLNCHTYIVAVSTQGAPGDRFLRFSTTCSSSF